MTAQGWIPEGIDLNRPSASRVYDYYLGGFHNFEADRELARRAIADWPDLPMIMKVNRAFLRRAVTHLTGLGVRQFLDVGSGIPTVGNVHEVAQAAAPEAKVVYVDLDPVAVAHSRAILTDNPRATVVMGDLRAPTELLADVEAAGLIDLGEPVALMMLAVLHFIDDDDAPGELIQSFRQVLTPGSYLAISHATHELHPPELTAAHRALYRRTATPMTMRGRAEVEALFEGFDVCAPGVTLGARWRPEVEVDAEDSDRVPLWVGIGLRT